MRVQDGHLPGLGGSEQVEAQRIERQGSAEAQRFRPGAANDRIEVSTLAGRISGALDSLRTDREMRVEALAQAYQMGTYAADPAAISHALVSDSLV
jgi:anti-sigma28 factor (negative regulator of flagellin synthesis)